MLDFDALVLGPVRDVFGEAVTLTRASDGAVVSLLGVFQEAYTVQAFGEDGRATHTTVAPNVGVRLSDMAALPARNDVITRAKTGEQYLVVDRKPDGLGWMSLVLKVKA